MKTTTVWKHGQAFRSQLGDNFFDIDGNRQEGPNPKALLLSGLAACSGIDVVDILEKMRIPFQGLEIDAQTEQTDEHPRVFKEIMVTYKLRIDEQYRPKVIKAIELSLGKYCGVSAMLRKNSEINYQLEILP